MNFKNNKGITLIALVITIIVIIILAGVSINLLMGNNGIVAKLKQAKIDTEISQIKEDFELYKVELLAEQRTDIGVEEFIEYAIGKDKHRIEIDDGTVTTEKEKYVVIDGEYEFLIEKKENDNIEITYLGKVKEGTETTYIAVVENGELEVTVTSYNGIYTGEAKGITVTCKQEGAKIEYSKDGLTGWTTEKIEYTEEGEYTVYYKVSLEGYETVSGSKTVTIRPFQITYNANGGIDAPSAQSFKHGSSVIIPATKPTKEGYFFAGWSTNPSATTATYFEGKTYTFNGDTTLYAVWTRELYLYKNGNEYTDVTGGWTFNAWEKNGYGTKNNDSLFLGYTNAGNSGGEFTTKNTLPPGKYQLYIKYKKTNNSGGNFWSGLYYWFGSEARTVINTYINGSYEEAFNVEVSDWSTLSIGNWDSNDYIYEVYLTHEGINNIPERLTVKFDNNGGISTGGSGLVESQSAIKGETLILNTRYANKANFIFAGWSTDPNATSATYLPGKTYSLNEDTTLYAVYVKSLVIYNYGEEGFYEWNIGGTDTNGVALKNSDNMYLGYSSREYSESAVTCWINPITNVKGNYRINVYYRKTQRESTDDYGKLWLATENATVYSKYTSTGYHDENFDITLNGEGYFTLKNFDSKDYIYRVTITLME